MAAALFAVAAAAQAQTNTAATSTNAPAAIPAHPPVAATTNTWPTTVAFGLTLARGNTDTTMASASARTEHKWGLNDLIIGAEGLYGESKSPGQEKAKETAETLHGFSQYNRSVTEGFYFYGRIDGFHDGIADIKYRLTLAPGMGYYFITNKTMDLSAEAGPGYIDEKLDDHSDFSYATLRFAERFHYNISPHAKAWELIEFLPQVDNFDNYIINFEMGVDAGLTKGNKLNLRTVLQDHYDNVPAAGKLKNDLKLIAALAYKF
jgi:putative salt-induced outer membrane protein